MTTTTNANDQTVQPITCPDWCQTNHEFDPDGGHDGPRWPTVQSLRGDTGRDSVSIAACQTEDGAMAVYLAAGDLPLSPEHARAAGLALLSAASWAKDHAVTA